MNMKIAGLAILLLAVGFTACNDGIKRERWDDGAIKSELRYEGELLNGVSKWYFQNGNLQVQANYVDNKLEGKLTRWHEDGIVSEECWYKSGVRDSLRRSYSAKGVLVSEEHYTHGELNGEVKKWYENGQVFMEGQYADGMLDGSWMVFYESGNLSSTANYVMGKGTQTGYDESGYKCMTVSYENNVKQGKETRYGPDGKVVQTLYYDHGHLVDSLEYFEKQTEIQ